MALRRVTGTARRRARFGVATTALAAVGAVGASSASAAEPSPDPGTYGVTSMRFTPRRTVRLVAKLRDLPSGSSATSPAITVTVR